MFHYAVSFLFILVLNSNQEKHNYHKLILFKYFRLRGIDANNIFIVHFKQMSLRYPLLKGFASKEIAFAKTLVQWE